jgi:predicted Zn-dependent peptidase
MQRPEITAGILCKGYQERIILMHKITELDNGFRIISSRLIDVDSLAIGIWIKTGGRYENRHNQGISHLMEHMLFKGTKTRSCQALKRSIESKGGAFNAFTSEENVCYYVKILSGRLALASGILADMILNPALKKEDMEKEKRVIFEEIRMYIDLPMHYVNDLLDSIIWPDHPLGLPLAGTYETVKAITRNDLIKQKKQFYAPNNMIAVACGNISHADLVDIMKGLFAKERPVKQHIIEKPAPCAKKASMKFIHKETEQTHLCLGLRGVSNKHPQRYALSLLSIILGGNMSSRLFNEIREKRSLAYEIGASQKTLSDTGSFFIHAGVDNKKLHQAVSIIIYELEKIKSHLVTKREFSMAKEYFKSGLLMAMESTLSNMMFFGDQITSADRVQTKEAILKGIDKVTPFDIQRIAKRLFNRKALRLAFIGPQSEKELSDIKRLL